MLEMPIRVAVSVLRLGIGAPSARGLAAREPRHGTQELFGVVVVGGADFVRRGLDGPVFQDLDHELVDFHSVTPSVVPRLACGPPRWCSIRAASRTCAPGSPPSAPSRHT